MKKKIFSLLFFLFFLTTYSQVTYQIKYKLNISFVEENQVKDRYLKYAIAGAEETLFQLDFNKTKSEFKEINNSKSKQSILAKAWCDYLNPIYTDLDKKTYYYNNPKSPVFAENTYLIYKNEPTKWELTPENKMINNLKCYKATTIFNQGGKDKLVTAWYCLELPYSVGPIGFSGLPGAILELQMDNVLFGAQIINRLDTEQLIEIPKVGKLISEIDYIKMLN